jgi:hypothetical protein
MSKATKNLRASLERMRVPELQRRFAEVTGTTTRSPNKTFMIRRIMETVGAAARAAPEAHAETTASVAESGFGNELTREEDRHSEDEPGNQEPLADVDPGASDANPVASVLVALSNESNVHEDPPSCEERPSGEIAFESEASNRESERTTLTPGTGAVDRTCIVPNDNEAPYIVVDLAPEPALVETHASSARGDEETHDDGSTATMAAATDASGAETTDGERAAPTGLPRGALINLTIEALQAKYLEVVGRPTGSADRAYLVWKIREAAKGKIPTGPRTHSRRTSRGADVIVLPLRLPASMADAMDHAWRSRGIRTRMDFLREAIRLHLERLGAADVALLFARAPSDAAEAQP